MLLFLCCCCFCVVVVVFVLLFLWFCCILCCCYILLSGILFSKIVKALSLEKVGATWSRSPTDQWIVPAAEAGTTTLGFVQHVFCISTCILFNLYFGQDLRPLDLYFVLLLYFLRPTSGLCRQQHRHDHTWFCSTCRKYFGQQEKVPALETK